jgi:nitroreductase
VLVTEPLPAAPTFGTPVEQPPRPEVLGFLARRRSASAVTLAEPAPGPEALDQMLRLAVRAPDHGKLSPWRFIVLDGDDKRAFAAKLEALAASRGDTRAIAKLIKLKAPPMGVAVISSPVRGEIPEWEQWLSAGAVCTNLLYAAQAMGFGANWITDWYAYDGEATEILGLKPQERVAGFIFMGSPKDPPLERERPDSNALITRWRS